MLAPLMRLVGARRLRPSLTKGKLRPLLSVDQLNPGLADLDVVVEGLPVGVVVCGGEAPGVGGGQRQRLRLVIIQPLLNESQKQPCRSKSTKRTHPSIGDNCLEYTSSPFSAPSQPLLSPFSAPSQPLRSPFSAPSQPLRSPFAAPSQPLLSPKSCMHGHPTARRGRGARAREEREERVAYTDDPGALACTASTASSAAFLSS
eukprot:1180223-Prorocentrum_minimum.AAC.1